MEIERKFLVTGDGWRPGYESRTIRQGYLAFGPPASVRIRISAGKAHLNIKRSTLEISRDEFEYPISVDEAEFMLKHLCQGRLVEKTRHWVRYAGRVWEVDLFEGANAGLAVAEVELDRADQAVELPPWAGREVSGEARYLNSGLAQRPFSEW
jgi:CYTH domain-containing protein